MKMKIKQKKCNKNTIVGKHNPTIITFTKIKRKEIMQHKK